MFGSGGTARTPNLPARGGPFAGLVLLGLAACGGGGSSSSDSTPPPPAAAVLHGSAFGGRQPIVGAAITAYAAGATPGGSAAAIGHATTDAQGAFNIMAFSPLPSPGQIIYAVAQGGNAGGGINAAIRLMTVAGAYCSGNGCAFPQTVNIDELGTVASVYSLAQYLGSSSGAVNLSGAAPGLNNAAATAGNLVDPVSGQAAALFASANCGSAAAGNCATLQKLDTLANLAAACVNSSGPSSSACAGLSGHTGGAGNTLDALAAIATLPAVRNDAGGLYALATAPAVYTPALAGAPNDWTLALSFGGGGLSAPAGVAIDAQGNVWVADNTTAGALSKFSPTGAALSPATGYSGNGLSGPLGLAIDSTGHIWVANWAQGSGSQISEFNADGSAADGSPFSGGISGPIDIALTPAGDAWIANFGNSTITHLGTAGQILAGPITGHGQNFPTGIALDAAGDLWVLNQSGDSISEFDGAGTPIGSSAYADGGLSAPYAIALDQQGNAWAANQSGQSITKLVGGNTPPSACPAAPAAGDTGCALSPSTGFKSGGLSNPVGIAIDGRGQVWISNFHGASVTELSPSGAALSPASAYTGPGLAQPYGLAVDRSGNLWVANFAGDSLTEFIGIAAPVTTPKAGLPQSP